MIDQHEYSKMSIKDITFNIKTLELTISNLKSLNCGVDDEMEKLRELYYQRHKKDPTKYNRKTNYVKVKGGYVDIELDEWR